MASRMKRKRHEWALLARVTHHYTDSVCRLCGLVKRGRIEPPIYWTEYRRGDKVISIDEAPECSGVMR